MVSRRCGREARCAVVSNKAGLFKDTMIRNAEGNKLSNYWKVLKSALFRVTPPQPLTRKVTNVT